MSGRAVPQVVVDTVAAYRAQGLTYKMISRATGLTRNKIGGTVQPSAQSPRHVRARAAPPLPVPLARPAASPPAGHLF